jgi:hypothetical protein
MQKRLPETPSSQGFEHFPKFYFSVMKEIGRMRGHKTQDREELPPFEIVNTASASNRAGEVSTNFVYTTEYLKLRVGKHSTAIELRSFNGKIVSRNADMLSSSATEGWCEVGIDQLNTYRTQFPAVSCWLRLIGQR